MTEPLSRSALHPRARSVARSIVASTERLVEQMGAEDWALIPETLRQRRGLLRMLQESHSSTPAHSCIAALRAAVSESERVTLLIVPADAAGLDT